MYNESAATWGTGYFILCFIFAVFYVIVMWKVFVKAGKPGWGSIIPIYNIILMLEIVDRPIWWIILFFVPVVNIIIGFIVLIDFARAFGKDTGFGVGLILLGFIFFPILAFGDAQYVGIKR